MKKSIVYGLLSFVLLYASGLLLLSFKLDFSELSQMSLTEKLVEIVLLTKNLLYWSLPGSVISGCVFYFYIFPREAKKE